MSALELLSVPVMSRVLDWIARQRPAMMTSRHMSDTQQPSNEFLLEYVTALSVISLMTIVTFRRLHHRDRHGFVQACGVSLRKVARSVREIQRKG